MKTIPKKLSEWLLEKENPSVRYRFLTEYLSEKPTSPSAKEAKRDIAASKPVERIFSRMHPDGYWLHRGKGAGIEYACSASTHYALSYLAELGMTKEDRRIETAVERYLSLDTPDRPDPAPWQIPPDYRNRQSCLYAMNLRTFQMLGYGSLDLRALVAALRKRGFEGPFTVEVCEDILNGKYTFEITGPDAAKPMLVTRDAIAGAWQETSA